MNEITLKIEGMDCPSCAGPVEKAVRALPGVKDVSVNFGNGKMKLNLEDGGVDATAQTKMVE